jgi:hypothetical protein
LLPSAAAELRAAAAAAAAAATHPAGAVDLGAMWIHEAGPGNAVYDLTKQLGINISQPHNYQSASLYNPDGSPGAFLNYAVRSNVSQWPRGSECCR